MSVPDPFAAMRRILLDEASVTDLLLPQDALPQLATPPIFALNYPRLEAGKPKTGYTGHDWAALLNQKSIRMVLITSAGREPSVGDASRVPFSRPRMDIQCYGRSESDAMAVHLAVEAFLKQLGQARAVLSGGTVRIADVTVTGGPIQFPDPQTEAPIVTGTYAASFIEEYVA